MMYILRKLIYNQTMRDKEFAVLCKERDDLKAEVELIREEYEVLKQNVIKLIEAQRALNEATINLRLENQSLRQLTHLSALIRSKGNLQ